MRYTDDTLVLCSAGQCSASVCGRDNGHRVLGSVLVVVTTTLNYHIQGIHDQMSMDVELWNVVT